MKAFTLQLAGLWAVCLALRLP